MNSKGFIKATLNITISKDKKKACQI